MIENKLNELFEAINHSSEYQAYKDIGDVLKKDDEINHLVREIKKLQQESVRLEYNNDPKYKEIDKIIEEKVGLLNEKPIYKEYLNRMNEFNDVLANSSHTLEEYINSKVQ